MREKAREADMTAARTFFMLIPSFLGEKVRMGPMGAGAGIEPAAYPNQGQMLPLHHPAISKLQKLRCVQRYTNLRESRKQGKGLETGPESRSRRRKTGDTESAAERNGGNEEGPGYRNSHSWQRGGIPKALLFWIGHPESPTGDGP